MTDNVAFAALAAIVGLVSIYGRSPWLRAGGYAALVAGVLLLWFTALGVPRPEYFRVPEGTVVAYRLDEPHAIYVWLVPEGSARPLALELPWQNDTASSLVDTDRQRTNAGESIKLSNRPENDLGLRSKPVFYVSRSTGLPPKTVGR